MFIGSVDAGQLELCYLMNTTHPPIMGYSRMSKLFLCLRLKNHPDHSIRVINNDEWWPEAELNHRHKDF